MPEISQVKYTTTRRFVIKSEEERFVLGEVYFPADGAEFPIISDTQKDFMLPGVVRKIAHNFLKSGRVNKIDRQHDEVLSGNLVAESFIVRGPNDPDGFAEGAWVLGAYIQNEADWEKVKKGEFNGWSWAGPAIAVPVLVEAQHPIRMTGDTELYPPVSKSENDQHFHSLQADFTDSGAVIPTITSPAPDGHTHPVFHTTATEEDSGHSHRIVLDL
jgi:hypothetical protein